MAGGRRNVGKISRTLPATGVTTDDPLRVRCPLGPMGESLTSRVLTPRHIPIPAIPQDSAIIFEFYMFLFTTLASFLQFLHLYRSVWWLPQSYTIYTMNFYLIDPYLVGFILTILSRRFIYSMAYHAVSRLEPKAACSIVHKILTLLLLSVVLIILVFCACHILKNHPIVNIFYLCYPLSVYFILFGLSITPFFDISYTYKGKDGKPKYGNGKPVHSCSLSPQFIREEVDTLKTDFNARMKQVLFSSVLNAYYAGFVPCCFAQPSLFYDPYWATQHMALVWLGCFTMHSAHCYPAEYCDTLHRAALHLGKWVRVQWRNQHVPTHVWDETTLWSPGALVRHSKDLYRAEGVGTAAEPGNSMHCRFYALFNNPSGLVWSLLIIQGFLVVLQMFALFQATEWHHVVSVTLLLLANYSMLFRLSRDYLICCKVYKLEQHVQEKMPG